MHRDLDSALDAARELFCERNGTVSRHLLQQALAPFGSDLMLAALATLEGAGMTVAWAKRGQRSGADLFRYDWRRK